MMTSDHWKNQTKRGVLTPRSNRLEAIDKAFVAYENAKKTNTGTTVALTKLFDTLIAWIQAKGTAWRQSTRNSKIEPGGKGTVETLLNELIALNPAFKIKGGPYLAQAAPPKPKPMSHGAKNSEKDVDGNWHEVFVQKEENSCGPCSLRMVIKAVTNREVGEEYMQELVEVAEEGGAYGGSLGSGGVLQSGGAHDWSPTGGGTWLVPAALKAAHIDVRETTSQNDLLKTSAKKPAIAVVKWTGGGLHYVVVKGLDKSKTELIVVDPFYGVQSAPADLSGYHPVDSNAHVLANATWYPWVCQVV